MSSNEARRVPLIHIYRGILKHLNKNCPSSKGENSMVAYVREQFRNETGSSSKREMAYDYWKLVTDLSERKRLHALDGGAENVLSAREMSRRSAARAGLQLPQEYKDNLK